MSTTLGLSGTPDPPITHSQPQAAVQSNLTACPDCGRTVSRMAEACPGCGRYFRRYDTTITVDRSGWSLTVAWGVIVAGLIVWVISFVVSAFVFFLIFGAAIASSPGLRR